MTLEHHPLKLMNVRIRIIYTYGLVLLMVLLSCKPDDIAYKARYQPFTEKFARGTGYNLLEPYHTYILPETLTEISGLSTISDSLVACIQDETGIIFTYSLDSGEIVDKQRFEGGGDYEGIQIVGDIVYILKSNGKIYRYALAEKTTELLKTPLKGKNDAEGLGFDPKRNRLLIACKAKPGLDGIDVKGRAIYEYHLENGFNSEIAYLVTPEDLERWNNDQKKPINLNQRRRNFMPSGIAVHPITGEIYLLANVGKLLLVLTPDGIIKHGVPLAPRIFRQPEGICFTSSGTLIIANEGQDGNGKIHMFAMTEGLKD